MINFKEICQPSEKARQLTIKSNDSSKKFLLYARIELFCTKKKE